MTFLGAVYAGSKVTNSAFHTGEGIGVFVKSSSEISLENNVLVNFTQHGIWV